MVHWHTDYNGHESMHKCERDALASLKACGIPPMAWAELCANSYASWGNSYASIEECDCPDCTLDITWYPDVELPFSDADCGL